MGSRLLSSPVGKKLGMALTGLLLYGFLIGHLGGNLLLLKGDRGQAFNAYSDYLSQHPLLVPVELLLLAIFLLHVYLAILVTLENRRARPVGYRMNQSAGGRTWASSTMIYSGLLILVFLVFHIKSFKYGDHRGGTLYDLVVSTFQQPEYAIGYAIAMVVLGFHLWHAFQSAFQTLGLGSRKVKSLGLLLCLILAIGFGSLPIYLSSIIP